jgi:hypothetical protein
VKNGNEVILESYLGYFIRPTLLFGMHLDSTFGENQEVSGQKISDSGVRIYKTGLSLNWLGGTGGRVGLGNSTGHCDQRHNANPRQMLRKLRHEVRAHDSGFVRRITITVPVRRFQLLRQPTCQFSVVRA